MEAAKALLLYFRFVRDLYKNLVLANCFLKKVIPNEQKRCNIYIYIILHKIIFDTPTHSIHTHTHHGSIHFKYPGRIVSSIRCRI